MDNRTEEQRELASSASPETIERMRTLAGELAVHDFNYYTLDSPVISDKQYDELYDELIRLERESGVVLPESPSLRIGGETLKGFDSHRHRARLWSLDKAKDEETIRAWQQRLLKAISDYNLKNPDEEPLPEPSYAVELKFDGLTLNLTYEGGELVQAATRGNGTVGESILAQVKTIRSVPLTIPYKEGLIEVQGEGVMFLSVLEAYNKTAAEPLKNARNAAAGALRNLSPKVTGERRLNAFFYNIGYADELEFRDHAEMLQFLRDNRFKVNPYVSFFDDIEGVIAELHGIAVRRSELDFLIDGAVVKVTDMRTRSILGYTDKFPRWAIAFKFEAEESTTVLESVSWNVGRTGKVTPLARVEAVELAGVTVQNCTLNNIGDIERKGLKYALGTSVFIRRSNDVIPEILGKADEDEQGEEIVYPDDVPPAVVSSSRRALICSARTGLAASRRSSRELPFRLTGRDGYRDVQRDDGGAAAAILRVHDPADLYDLSYEDLIGLERFGQKGAQSAGRDREIKRP